MSNSNWILRKDGWHKKRKSTTQGSAGYFTQPEPVVRDDHGRPLASDRLSIDVARWVQEVNERESNHA